VINWQDLLAAVSLVLVIEGVLPFVSPDKLRRMMSQLQELSDSQLRRMGVFSMIAGLVLLYFVKQ